MVSRGWIIQGVLAGALCLSMWGCGPSGGQGDTVGAGVDTPAPSAPDSPAPGNGTPTPPTEGPAPDGGTSSPDAGAPPKPTVCAPTGAGPYWLQEGEPVTVTLRCGTGYSAAGLRFTVSPLPAGATVDEASGTFRWTPGKAQAAVWLLTVTEQSTGETGLLKVGVADNFLAPGNVREVDPLTYTEEYGLPVFHLSFDDSLTSGGYRPVRLVYRGRRFELEAKYRGATSSVFPKRSFTFKFPDEDLFSEPVFGDGFKDKKRLVLITTFNDNSYVRARLAFDLWNRMAPDHVKLRTYSAVVYVNNRFMGLYTVADHVDKRLMAAHGISKDADLFKAVENNANFSRLKKNGDPKPYLWLGIEKKEGTPEEGRPHAFDPMDALVAFVSDSDAATFRAGFPQRMKASEYEDWWIFNTLILGMDSQAKNAYHAYDPATGGPWRFIPWDLDASFGQHFDTTRTSPTARPTFADDNLLFKRMLEEPTIAGPMRERYGRLLRNELKLETALSLIDGYVKETAPAARRDWAKWWDEYQAFGSPQSGGDGNFPNWDDRKDFNSYEQEVDYVRQWVKTRWPALQERLP